MIDNTTTNTSNTADDSRHECGLTTPAVAWVQEHGSEFLRFCVAEGAFCVRAYNEERAQKEAPGWSLLDEAAYQPYSPPVKAMEMVLRARERFPNARLRQIYLENRDECVAIVEYVAVVDAPWPDGQKLVFDDKIVVAIKDD